LGIRRDEVPTKHPNGPRKSLSRGERKLATLRRELARLRVGYALVLSRKLKARGDLPGRILALKSRISKLAHDVAERVA
jgi:hypothetical protein